MPRPGALAAAVLVAALAVSVAAPSLHYGFVYDDEAVVLQRKPFWTFGLREFVDSRPWGTGRHLTAVSLDLDRLEQGTVPLPFHRTNLALSALLSLLVLALLRRLELSPWACVAGAAVFAVHPVHVDAVAWIVGRAELLAAIGVVAAVLLAIRPLPEGDDDTDSSPLSLPSGGARNFLVVAAGSALLAFAALHAKENALVLPLLLLLARFFLGRRVAIVPALAGTGLALALWAVHIVPRFAGFEKPQFVDNPLIYAPLFDRIPKALDILWRYAALTLWPHPLLPDRSFAQTDPAMPEAWLATAAWIVAVVAVWRMCNRAPRAAFALAWFPAAFAITANVVSPIGLLMAERLMLLPSVSVALLVALAFDRVATTPARRRGAIAFSAAVVVVLFGAFRTRAEVWQDNDVYFAAAVKAAPRSAKAWYDQGNWLLRSGKREQAEAAYEKALTIVPSLTRAAQYLAESRAKRGDAAGGVEAYKAYLETTPDDAGAVKNCTRLLLQAGRNDEALAMAQRLVALKPGDPDALDSLVTVEAVVRRNAAKAKTVVPAAPAAGPDTPAAAAAPSIPSPAPPSVNP